MVVGAAEVVAGAAGASVEVLGAAEVDVVVAVLEVLGVVDVDVPDSGGVSTVSIM